MNTPHRLRRTLIVGAVGAASLIGLAGASSASASADEPHRDKSRIFADLTDEQRSCLTDAGLSRPTGRPTVVQRQALRDAAADCGIDLPARANTGRGQ